MAGGFVFVVYHDFLLEVFNQCRLVSLGRFRMVSCSLSKTDRRHDQNANNDLLPSMTPKSPKTKPKNFKIKKKKKQLN